MAAVALNQRPASLMKQMGRYRMARGFGSLATGAQ
jgi:hypothetical protein